MWIWIQCSKINVDPAISSNINVFSLPAFLVDSADLQRKFLISVLDYYLPARMDNGHHKIRGISAALGCREL